MTPPIAITSGAAPARYRAGSDLRGSGLVRAEQDQRHRLAIRRRRLDEHRRFVIRYDLRDTGRSTTVDPDSPGYTLRERLPEITAPTLVVHGAADPFFPVGNAKALAEEIPHATLLVLDGVGAELPSRAHAEVATAVLTHTAP